MTNEKYMELLMAIDEYFEKEKIVLSWSNGLVVKGRSFTGIMETDIEPDEEDFIGEYTIAVNEVEVVCEGTDDSVEIFDNTIEISLKCIPEKIALDDGKIIWERKENF